MLRKNRLYGLMAGITAGFAVWGMLPAAPVAPEKASAAQGEAGAPVTEREKELFSELNAASAVLMDGDSGRILFSKNGEEFRPVASTTKMMTCILALEEAPADQVCVFSGNAAAQPKVRLGARAGTEFYLKDLLYSLMLESHNDTAVAVAEAVAGSVPEFAERMNRKAEEIGCTDTCFITPNGLDAQRTAEDGSVSVHGSTAADLARILRYCVMESPEREKFLDITQTMNYSFSDLSGNGRYACRNHNALLTQLDGVISGKTGFTGGAGYCYAGAYQNGDRTFILALLACGWPPHKTWKWSDARKLFAYGAENYYYQEIRPAPLPEKLPVEDGVEEAVRPVLSQKGDGGTGRESAEGLRLLLSEKDVVRVKTDLPRTLSAPVEQGRRIGSLVYELNGTEIRRIPLYADRNVKKRTIGYYLKRLWNRE